MLKLHVTGVKDAFNNFMTNELLVTTNNLSYDVLETDKLITPYTTKIVQGSNYSININKDTIQDNLQHNFIHVIFGISSL